MKNRVLIKRYSQGLIYAIGDEEEFAAVYKELRDFLDLLESREKLQEVLQSPFLSRISVCINQGMAYEC